MLVGMIMFAMVLLTKIGNTFDNNCTSVTSGLNYSRNNLIFIHRIPFVESSLLLFKIIFAFQCNFWKYYRFGYTFIILSILPSTVDVFTFYGDDTEDPRHHHHRQYGKDHVPQNCLDKAKQDKQIHPKTSYLRLANHGVFLKIYIYSFNISLLSI